MADQKSGIDDVSDSKFGHRRWLVVRYLLLGQAIALSIGAFSGNQSVLNEGNVASTTLSRASWLTLVVGCTAGIALVPALNRRPRSARILRNTLVIFFLSQLLSSVFAGQPISVNLLLPPLLVVIASERFPVRSQAEALRVVRASLMIPIVASVASFILGYEWSVVSGDRRVPFAPVEGRLVGVFSHPNALGFVAAVGLTVAFAYPSRFRWLWVLLSAFALWGSDSRTALLAAPFAMLLVVILRPGFNQALRVAALSIGLGALIVGLHFSGAFGSIASSGDAQTLNGRTDLWAASIDYWQTSPIVGVGGSAFDSSYRVSTGRDYAGQAHNQFFQTVAAEGLLGLVSLTVAMAMMVGLAFRKRHSGGAPLAVLSILFLVMLTESPLRAARWSAGLFVVAVALVLLVAQPVDSAIDERDSTESVEP